MPTRCLFVNTLSWPILLLAIWALTACSTTKHVPDNKYLLDKVEIIIEPDSLGNRPADLSAADLYNYLRQVPNHKVLGFLKLQLNTYNLSGSDTTSRWNRWLRRIGQAPVIYDSVLTRNSANQLRLALANKGYLETTVTVDSVMRPDKKKASLTYHVKPGTPHRISSFSYEIPDSAIARILLRDTARAEIQPGAIFDRDKLEQLRTNMAARLQRRGYYGFSKEYITFYADTAANSTEVDLTLVLHAPPVRGSVREDSTAVHNVYKIRNVIFVTDYHQGQPVSDAIAHAEEIKRDSEGYITVYGDDRYIKPSALIEKCFITPGARYNSAMVDRTYEYMAQLGIIRSINIELLPVTGGDGQHELDAYVLLIRNRKQSVSFEVEGTNSEGDLGFGVGVTYQHRNLFHGSQLFTAKFRSSYESLSGNLDNFINNRYTEQAAEVGITFPRFIFPFLSRRFKHNIKASSELALSFNYQERPEFTRIIAGAGWKYKWNNRRGTRRSTWDFVDISYVHIPNSIDDFIDQLNPRIRYSYEDHFIMRMGFTYQWTNRRIPSANGGILTRNRIQPRVYNMRAAVETAGNLLYAYSSIFKQRKSDGVYKIFGTQYAQYAKAEFDYTVLRNFNSRHGLAFHAGLGVAFPYGNSKVIPFEKRFYAGGANGVRGWAVRTLGPGGYPGGDGDNTADFLNQCGDINLLLSLEYRAKLFWLLEGALFVDAGNIWTIRSYENQPYGVFKFDKFWQQMAMAYGAGLRMDFTYFIFRIDLGLKLHNPAEGQLKWPITKMSWKRDATFLFAVGYPF